MPRKVPIYIIVVRLCIVFTTDTVHNFSSLADIKVFAYEYIFIHTAIYMMYINDCVYTKSTPAFKSFTMCASTHLYNSGAPPYY